MIKNMKIFDMNNHNVVISNDLQDVKDMLIDVPMLYDMYIRDVIIGYVKNVTHDSNGEIYGDVYLLQDKYTNCIEFKNYEISGDRVGDVFSISSINMIEVNYKRGLDNE